MARALRKQNGVDSFVVISVGCRAFYCRLPVRSGGVVKGRADYCACAVLTLYQLRFLTIVFYYLIGLPR